MKQKKFIIILVILTCFAATAATLREANGIPGQLPTAVERPGRVDTNFNPAFGPVTAMALQPDGKMVLSGFVVVTNPVTQLPTTIFRLDRDGSLDPTFRSNRPPPPSFFWEPPIAIGVEADGKILVDGFFRLQPDGIEDSSFHFPELGGALSDEAILRSTAIQPDGRILVSGDFSTINGLTRHGIVRLMPNGNLDETFDPAAISAGIVNVVLVQPDGAVIIGGDFGIMNTAKRSQIARLRSNGALDSDFFAPSLISNFDPAVVTSMVLQADGKLIVAGTIIGGILRLNPDGSIDPAWRSLAADQFVPEYPVSIALQWDGRIVFTWNFIPPVSGEAHQGVLRLNRDGTLDPSFDVRWSLDRTNKSDGCFWDPLRPLYPRVLILQDGDVLLTGSFTDLEGLPRHGLARLKADAPPHLTPLCVKGNCRISVSSLPGRTYVVEGSTDLRHWTGISTNEATGYLFGFEDIQAATSAIRFYRAVLR